MTIAPLEHSEVKNWPVLASPDHHDRHHETAAALKAKLQVAEQALREIAIQSPPIYPTSDIARSALSQMEGEPK